MDLFADAPAGTHPELDRQNRLRRISDAEEVIKQALLGAGGARPWEGLWGYPDLVSNSGVGEQTLDRTNWLAARYPARYEVAILDGEIVVYLIERWHTDERPASAAAALAKAREIIAAHFRVIDGENPVPRWQR